MIKPGQIYQTKTNSVFLRIDEVTDEHVVYHFMDELSPKSRRCVLSVFQEDIDDGVKLVEDVK